MMSFSFPTILCVLSIEFFCFSVLGWIMEVTLKYIQFHRFINRGFLIGPYCPIYGFGTVGVTVLVGGLFIRHGTVGEIFLVGMIICGALEYFTSWYMEKLFHARWWDYSTKPMNLNGRIWIGNLLLFGLASVLIVDGVAPFFFRVFGGMNAFWLHVFAIAIVALLLADGCASHFLMNLVKREIDSQEGDNTEEISLQVHALLRNRNMLMRRITQAYPNLQARPKSMIRQLKHARKQVSQARKELKQALRTAAKGALPSRNEAIQTASNRLRACRNQLRELQRRLVIRRDEDFELLKRTPPVESEKDKPAAQNR